MFHGNEQRWLWKIDVLLLYASKRVPATCPPSCSTSVGLLAGFFFFFANILSCDYKKKDRLLFGIF